MKNLLNSILKEYNINLDAKQISLFENYYNLLLEYNEKLNLTAITKMDEVVVKHFLDSLSVNFLGVDVENKNIIDVGSGGGFPGIPIAIKNSGSNITLLETIKKKQLFLESCINSLGLNNATSVSLRAEDGGKNPDFRETFDIAVSRAVTSLPSLLEYLLPFVKVGGLCVCYKSKAIEEELKASDNAMTKLGGSLFDILNYSLPNNMGDRSLVVIKKENPTPVGFPRRSGIPTKRPL